MKSFKELKVWQKGIELVAIVYKITASFPEEEKYSNSQNLVDFKQLNAKCEVQNAKCKLKFQTST
uniref:Four helix bundle protein n=1 Tax=Candidatus Methanophagaceae archaeon ANME-1 ERB6 TaxID=2759912 RepID=A0A7G9YV84_9EURY|nr:hypothetical protein LCNDFJBK_00004 [Methanosarcinales archaeon ANME-1 ERB6]